MDDGDIMGHPILVPSSVQEVDLDAGIRRRRRQSRSGAEHPENRSHLQREQPGYSASWRVHDVQSMAKVSTVTEGCITLGVAVGPRQYSADVVRAMHERVQLCQDLQTEFAVLRESQPHHILRAHGNTILQEQRAAEIYDEVGQRSLEKISRRAARRKRHPVLASPESGTKEREISRLLHTWEPS